MFSVCVREAGLTFVFNSLVRLTGGTGQMWNIRCVRICIGKSGLGLDRETSLTLETLQSN